VFEVAKPSHWAVVHERAWAKTKDTVGFNLRTMLLTAGSLVVGGGLHAWLRTTQAAVERVSVGFMYTGGFVAIAFATYVVNFIGSTATIYDEQQEEIRRHEDALNAYSKKRDLGDKLVELRRDGVKLRNRRLPKHKEPSIDGLQIAGWHIEVDDWKKLVIGTIKGQVSAKDYGRFETLDTYTPKVFDWQINSEHGRLLSMLSRRIEILLEIMANF